MKRILSVCASLAVALGLPGGVVFPADADGRALGSDGKGEDRMAETMDLLRKGSAALAEALDRGDSEGARKAAEEASRKALAIAGEASDAGSVLARALRESGGAAGAREAAARLRAGIDEAIFALNYKPRIDAPVPEGFPGPTPVGAIEVKEYPRTRSAEAIEGAALPGGRNLLFFQLFRHIERNRIPMTAPVVMSYEERRAKGEGRMGLKSMAFLYRSPETGKTGKEGTVEVRDRERLLVVSLGMRGEYTAERFAEGLAKLEAWLEGNKASCVRAGEPRVLAYNSPMVPAIEKYSELQIPVRRIEGPAKSGEKRSRTF